MFKNSPHANQPTLLCRIASRKTIFTIVAIGSIIYVLYPGEHYADIRLPTANETVERRCYSHVIPVTKLRSIATVTTDVTPYPSLIARLYYIHNGEAIRIGWLGSGRSPNKVRVWFDHGPPPFEITYGLADAPYDRKGGSSEMEITMIGANNPHSGGGESRIPHGPVKVVSSRVFPGRAFPHCERIIYIEGEREVDVEPECSVDAFANANAGTFRVLTIER